MVGVVPSLLILLISYSSASGVGESVLTRNCNIFTGRVNQDYSQEISRESAVLYIIPLDNMTNSTILRFEASLSQGSSSRFPLLFTVNQHEEMTSFQLPFTFDKRRSTNSEMYTKASRTLCTPEGLSSSVRNLTIRVTTSSERKIGFRFTLRASEEVLIADEHSITFDLTPTAPKYYKYAWENSPGVKVVRVLATSADSTCTTLSVQGPYCPVHDAPDNVEFDGFWQTMSTKGAMTIHKKDFPEGFVIVFVQHKDESRCIKRSVEMSIGTVTGTNPTSNTRNKTITLSLANKREWETGQFLMALLIPVFISLGVITVTCALFHMRHNWLSEETQLAFKPDRTLTNGSESNLRFRRGSESAETLECNSLLDGTRIPQTPESQSATSHELQQLPAKFEKTKRNGRMLQKPQNTIWQIRASLHIVTLQRKGHREVMKDSNRFYWTIIIVSIFYAIPVYQLIFHYLRVVKRTGEFDICYYNYLCSNRLWIFPDFNHFWSNVSYVIFGLAFNFIVGRRERNLRLAQLDGFEEAEEDNLILNGCCRMESLVPEKLVSCCCAPIIYGKADHGIPLHFGVYYAMGLALVMEGVLSAAYHLCPNQSNFQFDTCFMYVIAVLTILKIYQFRHPVHIGANQTFAILAVFALISVVGLVLEVYNDGMLVNYFRWTFIVIQFVAMSVLSVRYYAVGYIKDSRGTVLTNWSALRHLNQLPRNVQVDRMIFPVISMTLSAAVVIYCELNDIHFATYLLYTLIANVMGSCIYYIGIMKPLHGEFKNRTWIQPALYFLASLGIGTVGIYYFLSELTKWETTPSESRAVNEECSYAWFPFLPLYDNHDCWHFYSAMALFCAFMGLLIVDDDLLTTPQSQIPIF